MKPVNGWIVTNGGQMLLILDILASQKSFHEQ